MSSIDVPILFAFLYTLGFPIFIRGVDYLILKINFEPHRFGLRTNSNPTSFRNSRYTFLVYKAWHGGEF